MKMLSVYLRPGEWFCSDQPATIDTILGSCLGIVMRDRDGATCVAHCLLPRWNRRFVEANAGDERDARFVDRSLEKMMAFFDQRGAARQELDVQLFGGSQLLVYRSANRMPSVGRQNLDTALEILGRERIRITAQDVGGNRGRKILVDSRTGEVEVSYMQPLGVPA